MPTDRILYLPILVGAVNNYKNGIDFQRDDEGTNISNKNPNYNELTAIYWAWKNLENVDAVGLVHYRRFFSFDRKKKGMDGLTKKQVGKLLEETPVVLPKKRHYIIETNYSHYIHAHHKYPLDETRQVIADFYPQYLQSFDNVMSKRSAHMFNMFIMKWNYFDKYATWLFKILEKLERKIDISNFSVQEARVFGYLAEVLMDVWIEKGRISYKEIYWNQIGEKHTLKKAAAFLVRKFFQKDSNKTNTHF